jgi:hypothetical protein
MVTCEESEPETTALVVPENGSLTVGADHVVPAIVAATGDKAARRYLEFFAVTIENPNTREAYFRACGRFFTWCEGKGLEGHCHIWQEEAPSPHFADLLSH